MPLPKEALTLQGGCHCGAIRYKLEIPEHQERAILPTVPVHKRNSPDAQRYPFTLTCSCNDCREAAATILPAGVWVPADMITVSCLSRTSNVVRLRDSTPFEGKTFPSNSPAKSREANGELMDRDSEISSRPPFRPGMEMLLPSKASEDNFVGFYHSSPNRTRSFCQRCGTPLSINIWPMIQGFPDYFNVAMGSLDRKDLEKLGEPDMHVMWDCGIGWVREMLTGCKAPKYPWVDFSESA